jgi:hypothetical protein
MTCRHHFWLPGSCALLLAITLSSPRASADPVGLAEPDVAPTAKGGSALAFSASIGPSVVFGGAANPEYSPSFGRVGVWLGGELAYRSTYFVEPFFQVGYGFLASGESNLPSGPWGEGGLMEQELGMWCLSPGLRTEIWRLRPELGLGLGIVRQSNEFRGETNGVSQLALFTQLGVSVTLFEAARIRVDAGGKLAAARGAGITFMTLTLAARFDAFVFDGK